jgi:lipopolysaccharide/colanic/teichoic acid biosynthesis glycosyltransferase
MNAKIGKMAASREADLGSGRSGTDKSTLRVRWYAALLVIDCISLSAAFILGNTLWLSLPFASDGLNVAVVLVPLYLGFAANSNVFSVEIFTHWRRAARRSVFSLGAAAAAEQLTSFYLRADVVLSRRVFTFDLLVGVLLLLTTRYLIHRYTRRLLNGAPLSELVICDGAGTELAGSPNTLNAEALRLNPDLNDPEALDRIGRLLRGIDRVIISCREDRRVDWAAALKGANIRGEIVTPELSGLGSLGAHSFGGQPTLIVSIGPMDMRNRAIKRLFDLGVACVALLAFAPLMAFAALAIRLESKGPILFVQPRLGRGNQLFHIYKFRSMRADMCDVDGKQSTLRDDQRITRVGRIIRATSIDELPQILNVIKGDMSIVGPRPHALGSLAGNKLFWEVDQRYWQRHAIKPGITGSAQIQGLRGATHLQSDLLNRLQADLDYLNGWTVWRDLSIMIGTIRVLSHRNAY